MQFDLPCKPNQSAWVQSHFHLDVNRITLKGSPSSCYCALTICDSDCCSAIPSCHVCRWSISHWTSAWLCTDLPSTGTVFRCSVTLAWPMKHTLLQNCWGSMPVLHPIDGCQGSESQCNTSGGLEVPGLWHPARCEVHWPPGCASFGRRRGMVDWLCAFNATHCFDGPSQLLVYEGAWVGVPN